MAKEIKKNSSKGRHKLKIGLPAKNKRPKKKDESHSIRKLPGRDGTG